MEVSEIAESAGTLIGTLAGRTAAVASSSPVCTEANAQVLVASLFCFASVYHIVAFGFLRGQSKELRAKRSWIITTLSSGCISACSLPYVYQLMRGGFEWGSVSRRTTELANPASMFFVAYLFSDLFWGSVYYRDQIQVSSGWVHHSLYMVFVLLWLHFGWSHVFVAATIMELPTFIMGLGRINSVLRSYRAFTVSFLTTRVAFHLALLYSLFLPAGRLSNGEYTSIGPGISALCALPMHLFWGYKCVRSSLRRRQKRLAVAKDKLSATELGNGTPVSAAVLSEQESQARTQRLVAAAVRALWNSAPESWQTAYTEELMRAREQGLQDSEVRRTLVARRVLGRQVSAALENRRNNVPGARDGPQKLRVGSGKGITVPPELQLLLQGQKFVVSEFPVEREASGGRRRRFIGQMRRRLEVARRDMIVF